MPKKVLTLSPLLLLLLGALSGSSVAAEQKSMKDRLVGTWTLISISNESGSEDKRRPVSPPAKYTTIFEPNGRVTSTMTAAVTVQQLDGKPRPDTIKTVTFSGTYAVDDTNRSVTYQPERGSLGFVVATDPKTVVTIKGNQFEQVLHSPGSSATTREVWQRLK